MAEEAATLGEQLVECEARANAPREKLSTYATLKLGPLGTQINEAPPMPESACALLGPVPMITITSLDQNPPHYAAWIGYYRALGTDPDAAPPA